MESLENSSARRLASIDLLRGVAALSVVAFHTTRGNLYLDSARDAPWLVALGVPAAMGFSGVYLFFVISGFCIHLTWARRRAEGHEPTIDFLAFWRRRIWRLYPPYFVALSLFLLLLWIEGAPFFRTQRVAWDIGLHLFLVQNVDPSSSGSINSVFWTLAVEEQLYLAYFLLLALRRRLGWPTTLAICGAARVAWFGLGFVAHRLWGIQISVASAAATHWFVWALGAWSVEAWFGLVERPKWSSSAGVCGAILVVAGLLSLPLSAPGSTFGNVAWLISQPLWGVGFFVLVNRLTQAESAARPASLESASWLQTWWARAFLKVGVFSYSLYLTHEIVLSHLDKALAPWLAVGEPTSLLLRVFVLAPLAVGMSRLFFVVFERPFLTKRRDPSLVFL